MRNFKAFLFSLSFLKVQVKTVPVSAPLETDILPSFVSMMRFAMESPKPFPQRSREREVSTR